MPSQQPQEEHSLFVDRMSADGSLKRILGCDRPESFLLRWVRGVVSGLGFNVQCLSFKRKPHGSRGVPRCALQYLTGCRRSRYSRVARRPGRTPSLQRPHTERTTTTLTGDDTESYYRSPMRTTQRGVRVWADCDVIVPSTCQ